MTLRVPVTASQHNMADWVRKAANAINQLANNPGGGGGTTTNPLTMNNSGTGAASGTTFDGSVARTISYNTVGAAASGHDHAGVYQPVGSYLTGNQTITLSGDVTGSGATAITGTIANNAVTYAKMQDVSAASRLLGRGAGSGSGDPQEISLGAGLSLATTTLSGSGNLIGVQIITATGAGTYTPTTGTNSIVIELQGAGGGGGGVPQPGGTNVAASRAGAGGGYINHRLTANFSGASYSVGAKGTGGAAGSNSGNAGGDTTFTDTAGSPTTYTAGGGNGGAAHAGGSAPYTNAASAAGGTTTNGTVQRPGQPSIMAFAIASTTVVGGQGGSSCFGSGGAQVGLSQSANNSTAGVNATGKGAGGSGAIATGTGAARAGGDGSDGIIIIWEYS